MPVLKSEMLNVLTQNNRDNNKADFVMDRVKHSPDMSILPSFVILQRDSQLLKRSDSDISGVVRLTGTNRTVFLVRTFCLSFKKCVPFALSARIWAAVLATFRLVGDKTALAKQMLYTTDSNDQTLFGLLGFCTGGGGFGGFLRYTARSKGIGRPRCLLEMESPKLQASALSFGLGTLGLTGEKTY